MSKQHAPEKPTTPPLERTKHAKQLHTLILGFSKDDRSMDDLLDFITTLQRQHKQQYPRLAPIFMEPSVNGYSHLHDAVHLIPQHNNALSAIEKTIAILSVFNKDIFPILGDQKAALVSMIPKSGESLLHAALLSQNHDIIEATFSTVNTALKSNNSRYRQLLERSDNAGNNLLHLAALTDNEAIFSMVTDTITQVFGDDSITMLQTLASSKNSSGKLPECDKSMLIDYLLTEMRAEISMPPETAPIAAPEIAARSFVSCIPRPKTPPNYTWPAPDIVPDAAPAIIAKIIERPTKYPMNAVRIHTPSQRPHLYQERIPKPSAEHSR